MHKISGVKLTASGHVAPSGLGVVGEYLCYRSSLEDAPSVLDECVFHHAISSRYFLIVKLRPRVSAGDITKEGCPVTAPFGTKK